MIYIKDSHHPWKKIEPKNFPDGTLLLKTDEIDFEHDPIRIKWLYENDAELFTIICLAKKAKWKSLEMPYIPHARQDRVKSDEDVFTLKYFAEVINSLNFDRVWVLDPHSSVSEALIDRVEIECPENYIFKVIETIEPTLATSEDWSENLIMFYPDSGAMKRYAGMIPFPYCYGIKDRDWETGEIRGLDVVGEVDKIKDATILIVDDICSKGGTFLHSARKLKKLGAKRVFLYVTHCENTILEGELINSGLLDGIYTTNSIFTKEHPLITVFEV